MTKIADTIMETGYTFQQEQLLHALENQVCTGMLMCNPRVTGFTSFAKAVLNFIDDKKAPKTKDNLYKYLVANGLDKLPRVEVRIVTRGDRSFAGYAYLNKCIIHISEKTLDYSDVNLLHVVLHEVLHGIGYPHKQKCKLMHPTWDNGSIIESEQWKVFKSYVADYQNRC